MSRLLLAAVLVLVGVLVVGLVPVLVAILVIVLIGITIVLILIVHLDFLQISICNGIAVRIAYPFRQDLSLGLKIKLAASPAAIAAAIPPAQAWNPPVKIPMKPS